MTDHPRFQLIDGEPEQRHRHYHGGRVVDLVFRLADLWLSVRTRYSEVSCSNLSDRRTPSQCRTIASWIFILLALFSGVSQVLAQETVRVRGMIEEVISRDVYVIRTRDDTILKLQLAANTSVAASVKSSLADIKPGLFIGVAAVPQSDGALRALAVHIFDESMRGTGEGHRAWDLLPKSTMTNAVVQEIVSAVDGRAVTLTYKDGQKQVLIPSSTTVVTYLPGSVTELKPGATIFIPGAAPQSDGTLLAQRVMVGRDIAPPQ